MVTKPDKISCQSYKFKHSFLEAMLSVFAYAPNSRCESSKSSWTGYGYEGNFSLNWSTTDQFWQYQMLWMNWQQLECKLR